MDLGIKYKGLAMEKSMDTWSGNMSERMLCLLSHLRRIAQSDIRWRQATLSMTQQDIEVLCGPWTF